MPTVHPHPRRPRWRSLAVLALLLTPLLWPLQQLAERYYSGVLVEQNRQTLDLYVANLLGTLRRYEVLPPFSAICRPCAWPCSSRLSAPCWRTPIACLTRCAGRPAPT